MQCYVLPCRALIHLEVAVSGFHDTLNEVLLLQATIALHATVSQDGLELFHPQLGHVSLCRGGLHFHGVLHLNHIQNAGKG